MTDVSDIDYTTWLTKAQAAEALGVTPKTVERFVDDGKIQKSYWQPGGRGPTRVVYAPDDVARVATDRQRGPLPAFVVPSGAPNANGNGDRSLSVVSDQENLTRSPAPGSPAGEDVLRLLVGAALKVMSETSQTSVAETPWVDIPTAALILGRSQAYVRRQIKDGCLHAERDRCVVVRRKDLEAL